MVGKLLVVSESYPPALQGIAFLVTDGASPIGFQVVKALIDRGVHLRAADHLASREG
jgi:hypothetical protein